MPSSNCLDDKRKDLSFLFIPQKTAWFDSFRFCDELQRVWLIGTNTAEFYARVTPNAIGTNLQAVVHFNYWAFAFDDMKCDVGP